jgi:thiamine biosynthesis protein ThiC
MKLFPYTIFLHVVQEQEAKERHKQKVKEHQEKVAKEQEQEAKERRKQEAKERQELEAKKQYQTAKGQQKTDEYRAEKLLNRGSFASCSCSFATFS